MNILLIWLVLAGPVWAVLATYVVPRRYRERGLDVASVRPISGLFGATLGPLGVGYLYWNTPTIRRRHILASGLLLAVELWALFRFVFPDNVCNTSPGYVANQIQGGLVLGLVFGTMAVGLTLIYSVQGIISFAHGQFFMLGGVLAFLLATQIFEINGVFAVPIAGLAVLIVGALFERSMLSPMHNGRIERAGEYAILVTFGFGLFLQFALVGLLGSPTGLKAPRYTDRPLFGIDTAAFDLGPLRIRTDFWIAGIIGGALVLGLWWFLQRTWTGMSLRAVSQHRQASSIVGINSGRAFTLAFAIGSMLAGMAGAVLVPVLNFPVPPIAFQVAIRSYVIIVLGGLGSVIGAFLGGLFVGVAEALGAGCFPDPTRAGSYQLVFPLLAFALILLVRPRGLFGRER
ncbi:MAG: branched-chain amino acid ABC transporter permease [Acidimicrobiia bacterium]